MYICLQKNQFDILSAFAEGCHCESVQSGADSTFLTENGYISEGKITDTGFAALEPYRVKRAIFIAAGFGSRLVPITLNTPKPLVRVHNVRIIDSLLDAVAAAGIEEVWLVRGYLGEQFDQLLYKYPNIRFIENPLYNDANNISSMVAARDLLQNAYVLEADLLLYNPKLITRYQYHSNYLAIPMKRSDDWCFRVDERGVIQEVMVGGEDCMQMVGISYWTSEDGQRLAGHLAEAFNAPGGRERYWDTVPLKYFSGDYTVYIRKCDAKDVIEIDTFTELKALDKAYDI